MKKTVYFTGANHNTGQLDLAIQSTTEKRDEFLKENQNEIAKIDTEDIIITQWNGNNQNVITTIKLTYYLKES